MKNIVYSNTHSRLSGGFRSNLASKFEKCTNMSTKNFSQQINMGIKNAKFNAGFKFD